VTAVEGIATKLRDAYAREGMARLSSIVSHDLNNLILIVQGYAELLLKKSDDADRRQKQLEQIHSASLAAGRLSTQLLALSRHGDRAPITIDVNLIVRALRGVLGPALPPRATVDLVLTEEPGLAHYGLPALVEELIAALATVIAMLPEGGRLVLETSVQNDEFVVVRASVAAKGGWRGMAAPHNAGNLDTFEAGTAAVRLPIERAGAQESRA
jgi:signal transduction histidine kinase